MELLALLLIVAAVNALIFYGAGALARRTESAQKSRYEQERDAARKRAAAQELANREAWEQEENYKQRFDEPEQHQRRALIQQNKS